MRISEIFYSVQGEGALTGVPSVFVRTSGCNLRCRWCDTMYASWEPEGPDAAIDEISASVREHGSARHVVLTGGEPMVAKGIRELAGRLRAEGFHITIETAGTVAPDGIACDLASLSPKLSHSTPRPGEIAPGWIEKHEALRLQPEVIRQWIEAGEYQLKFVVGRRSDLEEIEDLLRRIDTKIPPDRVMLMPEGRTADELRERDAWLVEVCKATGFRYCRRIHIDLFGNRRGT